MTHKRRRWTSSAFGRSRQPRFCDVDHRLHQLSERGDPLAKLAATVDFEIFRAELVAAPGAQDRPKGGCPPFDPVLKVRMLVLQAMHGLSLAQTGFLVADRLSLRGLLAASSPKLGSMVW